MAVIACYCGDLTEGEKVLKSLRSFSSPILDAIQPMPFPQMQTLLDGAFPDGNYNYWKSTFLRECDAVKAKLRRITHSGYCKQRGFSPLCE